MKKNYILEYYQAIKNGSVTVGRWVLLVYKYIVDGLKEKKFEYSAAKANHAIEWIESHCFHVEGPLAPSAIKLELWEKALIACIYGIVTTDTKLRYWREVIWLVARKNGKSIIAASIADYEFQYYGGFGARVYNIAPKLEQADIVYGNAWAMMQLDPEYQEKKQAVEEKRKTTHTKVDDDPTIPKKRATDLFLPASNSTFKKIAFSARKSDGFNPSAVICDEIEAWEGDAGLKQYEVLRSGMGARPEGFILSCTTSGYINDGIFDELIKRSTRFLMGDSKELRILPFLYMIDDVDKWNDINELQKSNPNMGVSVSVDYLLEEISIAEGSLSKKAEFITKYCNLKQNSSLAWLDTATVNKCFGDPLDLNDFRSCYAICGVDLSQTTDLTAATCIIEKNGRLYVFAKFWLPSERIADATARDGLPYELFIQRGFLETSGENFVDYRDCFNWLVGLVEKYEILPLQVGYDRYSSQYLIQDLECYGFRTDDVFQGDNLYGVLLEMEGLMKDGRVYCGDNDLLKAHLLNAALKMNAERGRGKLVKINANAHIDGAAALADAFCVRQKYFNEIGEQLANRG